MSPIHGIKPRLPEAGRIRIGAQTEITEGPSAGKMRPEKLEHFRFTSHDPIALGTLAEKYGGEVQRWIGGNGPEGAFEVMTESESIDVFLPPAGLAFSQWYEEWSGAGCLRRCDGVIDDLSGLACTCDPGNRQCWPTTRLSLILDGLIGTGVWVLSTRGVHAAAELAGTVEIAAHVKRPGSLVPARLLLEQRESHVVGQPTRYFAVPRLDLQVSMIELAGGDPSRPALEAPAASAPAELDGARLRVKNRVLTLGRAVGDELYREFGPPEELSTHDWEQVEAYLTNKYPINEEPF